MARNRQNTDESQMWEDAFSDDDARTQPFPSSFSEEDEPTRVLHYEEPGQQSVSATAPYPVSSVANERGMAFDSAQKPTDITAMHSAGKNTDHKGRALAPRADVSGMRLFPALLGFLVASSALAALTWLFTALVDLMNSASYSSSSDALNQAITGSGGAQHAWFWWATVLALWALSFGLGGYSAARLTGFSRFKQGIAVWLWLVLAMAVSTILKLVLPDHAGGSLPFAIQKLADSSPSVDALAILALAVAALGGSLLGASVGLRYYKRLSVEHRM